MGSTVLTRVQFSCAVLFTRSTTEENGEKMEGCEQSIWLKLTRKLRLNEYINNHKKGIAVSTSISDYESAIY